MVFLALVVMFPILLLSAAFAVWQLAKADIMWTFVPLGEIKAVVRGDGNPIAMLANLQGYRVNSRMEIDEGFPYKNTLQKKWGLYWMGFPPAKIQGFWFVHERANPEIKANTPPSEWIKRDPEAKEETSLLWEIPHSYVIPAVEFADGFQADVMFESRSRVVKPLTAIFIRKGKFIDFMADYVNAGVIEILRDYDYNDFMTMPKTEKSELAKAIVENINLDGKLVEAVGLVMIGGFISRFEAPKELTEAIEAEKKAELAGKASIEEAKQSVIKAEQEAKKRQIQAEATRKAAMTEAEGQIAVFNAILKSIRAENPGISQAEALSMTRDAIQLAIATKFSDPTSPVVVLGGKGVLNLSQKEKK